MAEILRGYALAREQAFFKSEQEADVQRHRKKLLKSGAISPNNTSAGKAGKHHPTLKESEATYEVLSEVLQQRSRIDDPTAAKRREWRRRVRGAPAPPTAEELRRMKVQKMALGLNIGYRASMRIGSVMEDASVLLRRLQEIWLQQGVPTSRRRGLSPEAAAAIGQQMASASRAVAYGTLFGIVGFAAAGTLVCKAAGIHNIDDLRASVQAAGRPWGESVRASVVPLRASVQSFVAWVKSNQ